MFGSEGEGNAIKQFVISSKQYTHIASSYRAFY